MTAESPPANSRPPGTRALLAANFFLADVQTGLGPFLAAYLASAGWNAGRVGLALSLGGMVAVFLQTPAGAIVDRTKGKRALLAAGVAVLAVAAMLLFSGHSPATVYLSQALIGGASPFLAPTLAAITLGLVGRRLFDRQFGRNQSFNSVGNVFAALLIAAASQRFGNRVIFLVAALLTLPTLLAVRLIPEREIDFDRSRGGGEADAGASGGLAGLLADRRLPMFLGCAFLFHLANAAMLPQLGEMLARGSARTAAPFMSACIIVTQVVIACTAAWIGRLANRIGRKPLLLVGFGVLPARAALYTLTHATTALIAIQVLDGVANAVFSVVAVLVVLDCAEGTGRFNLAQGTLATAVGLGAALSPALGGKLIQLFSFRASFLTLGAVAVAALLLLLALPETRPDGGIAGL